jgi:hypothetical protein
LTDPSLVLHDADGNPVVTNDVGGVVLLLFGLSMLWKARLAFLHHTVLVPRSRWGNAAWMNPWQTIAVAGICFILGLVLAVSATRKKKRLDPNSSTDRTSGI